MSETTSSGRSLGDRWRAFRASFSEANTSPAPPNAQQTTTTLLFVVATLLGIYLLRTATDFIAYGGPELVWVWCAVIALISAPAAWVGYRGLPEFGRRFLKGGTLFLAVYFALEPFDIPIAALPPDHPAAVFHGMGRWIGLVLALVGFRSPAAVFASAMVLWLTRELQTTLTGFYFSTLDIRNVAEVIAFVALGVMYAAAARATPPVRAVFALDDKTIAKIIIVLIAAGIGGHLGNYFFSAMAKVTLDGGPFSWLFGNRLHDGLVGAMEKGTMPWAASPFMTSAVIGFVAFFNTPMNVGSFLAQTFAVIAPLRRKWLFAITLIYDLFHLIVYLTFGLLFWKWMALNTLIVATLWIVPDDVWDRMAKITCIVFVLIGAIFFKVATLAWYDASAFTSIYFEAKLDDGTKIRVPNAYFGSSSYQVSQGRFYVPPVEGHFNHSIWGSVLKIEDVRSARACAPPERDGPAPELYGPIEHVERFIAAHHAKTLARVDENGRFNYHLLPHHHVPSPFLNDPFAAVDKRRIEAYDYVVESVCLSLKNGRLQRNVVARSDFEVYRVTP